jgi:glycosyltransferase involved in cell wall biosynthesis
MICVSVVVPTYKRPELLARCLTALVAQGFDPAAYEILIADDAGSEETRRQVEEFAANSRLAIHYLAVTDRHGPAAARNLGWKQAQGEIIAFTDDDCLPEPHWLTAGVVAFEGNVAAVGGRVIVPLPAEPTDYQRDAAGLERGEFVTANCFCRREVLGAIGGFDERFATAWREDSDLQFVLLRAGYRIARAGGAVVVHPVRPAPWGVSLRQQRKSLFDALLYKKHPQLYRMMIRSGPPWDYYAMVLLVLMASTAAGLGQLRTSLGAACAWLALCLGFCIRRLRGTSHTPAHIAEMIVTSALIPPLSVYWRLYGAWKFRVPFA